MQGSIYIEIHFRGNPKGAGEAVAIIEFIDRTGKIHTRQQLIVIENDTKNALAIKICNAAMRVLLKPCKVIIHINNDYMANTFRLGWVEEWQKKGWKKADGKSPADAEDWKQFYMLTQIHEVVFMPYSSKYEQLVEKCIREEMENESNSKVSRE